MALPLHPPFPPMEARSVDEIPTGPDWQYEPKWDGFRCLVFRDGAKVELQSKSGRRSPAISPRSSRPPRRCRRSASCSTARSWCRTARLLVRRAAAAHPPGGEPDRAAGRRDPGADDRVRSAGGRARQGAGRSAAARAPAAAGGIRAPSNLREPSASGSRPPPYELSEAKGWLKTVGATLDGIIAKRRDLPYSAGDRSGMQKIKNYRSADCVVGGFRYNEGKKVVGSLLLGLHDEAGLLNHVGFTSTIKASDKPALTKKLKKLIGRARLHRQQAGRPEPLVDRTFGRMGAAQAEARRRGLLRPLLRRPFPPRHAPAALAAGQIAEAVHDGAGEAEEGGFDEAAGVSRADGFSRHCPRKRAIQYSREWMMSRE